LCCPECDEFCNRLQESSLRIVPATGFNKICGEGRILYLLLVPLFLGLKKVLWRVRSFLSDLIFAENFIEFGFIVNLNSL